jgi:DNA-binding response OmpR family regulator
MTNMVKILVVEDEAAIADLMATVLRGAGCDVQVAKSGRAGLEQAIEEKFDLITLDLNLGDADGFEICRELKQRHISYRTPIVFVTGNVARDSRQKAMAYGAADYITKPFQVEDFLARISSVAKGRFPQAEFFAPDEGPQL